MFSYPRSAVPVRLQATAALRTWVSTGPAHRLLELALPLLCGPWTQPLMVSPFQSEIGDDSGPVVLGHHEPLVSCSAGVTVFRPGSNLASSCPWCQAAAPHCDRMPT